MCIKERKHRHIQQYFKTNIRNKLLSVSHTKLSQPIICITRPLIKPRTVLATYLLLHLATTHVCVITNRGSLQLDSTHQFISFVLIFLIFHLSNHYYSADSPVSLSITPLPVTSNLKLTCSTNPSHHRLLLISLWTTITDKSYNWTFCANWLNSFWHLLLTFCYSCKQQTKLVEYQVLAYVSIYVS